jgi:hypothetical protein
MSVLVFVFVGVYFTCLVSSELPRGVPKFGFEAEYTSPIYTACTKAPFMKCRSLKFVCDSNQNLEIVTDPYTLDTVGFGVAHTDYGESLDELLKIPQGVADVRNGKPCDEADRDDIGLNFDCVGKKFKQAFTTQYFEGKLAATTYSGCRKPADCADYKRYAMIQFNSNVNCHFSIGIPLSKYLAILKLQPTFVKYRAEVLEAAEKFRETKPGDDVILDLFAAEKYNGDRSISKIKMRYSPVQLMKDMDLDLTDFIEPPSATPSALHSKALQPITEAEEKGKVAEEGGGAPMDAPPLDEAAVFGTNHFFGDLIRSPRFDAYTDTIVEPFAYLAPGTATPVNYVCIEIRDTSLAGSLVRLIRGNDYTAFNKLLEAHNLV